MNLKKIIALVLCVCMVLSFFPVSVFAEEWDEEIVLTDEEYYEEPQEEYVEEIIEEEPADYVEYVEPVEELVVEEELIDEEPAAPAEEPAAPAEEPAAPVEEPAAPAAELETAETFDAQYDSTKHCAKIVNSGFATLQAAIDFAAEYGMTPVVLTKDVTEDLTVSSSVNPFTVQAGDGTTVTGGVSVSGGDVTFDGLTFTGNVTVSGGTPTFTGCTIGGNVVVTDGEVTLNNVTVSGTVTIGGGDVVFADGSEVVGDVSVNGGSFVVPAGSTAKFGKVTAGTNAEKHTVKGGVFFTITDSLIAYGYKFENYQVVVDPAVAEKKAYTLNSAGVATYYDNVNAAVEAIADYYENRVTIYLRADDTFDLPAGKTVLVDKGEFTFTCNPPTERYYIDATANTYVSKPYFGRLDSDQSPANYKKTFALGAAAAIAETDYLRVFSTAEFNDTDKYALAAGATLKVVFNSAEVALAQKNKVKDQITPAAGSYIAVAKVEGSEDKFTYTNATTFATVDGVPYNDFAAAVNAAKNDTSKVINLFGTVENYEFVTNNVKNVNSLTIKLGEGGAFTYTPSQDTTAQKFYVVATDNTDGSKTYTVKTKIARDANNTFFYRNLTDAVADKANNNGKITILSTAPTDDTTLYNIAVTAENAGFSIIKNNHTVNATTSVANKAVAETGPDANGYVTYTLADAVCSIGTTTYPSVSAAIAAAKASGEQTTITLLGDVTEPEIVFDDVNVILDLGGNTLTAGGTNSVKLVKGTVEIKNGTVAGEGYFFYIYGSAAQTTDAYSTLTIANNAIINGDVVVRGPYNPATGAAVSNGVNCYGIDLNVNGTVNGCVFVSGNILEGNSVVDVYGTINSTNQDIGIALNGYATVNVYQGATVSARDASGKGTGIEVRSGILNVSGGTITGYGVYAFDPNPSGTSSTGVGIAVAQHTTQKNISVNVTGGNINGTVAFATANPQQNHDGTLNVSITGGTFTAAAGENPIAVVSDDERITGFVSGGTFSSALKPAYCATNYEPHKNVGAGGEVSYGVMLTANAAYEIYTIDPQAPHTPGTLVSGYTSEQKTQAISDANGHSELGLLVNINDDIVLTDGANINIHAATGKTVNVSASGMAEMITTEKDYYTNYQVLNYAAALLNGDGEIVKTYSYTMNWEDMLADANSVSGTIKILVTPAREVDYTLSDVENDDHTHKTLRILAAENVDITLIKVHEPDLFVMSHDETTNTYSLAAPAVARYDGKNYSTFKAAVEAKDAAVLADPDADDIVYIISAPADATDYISLDPGETLRVMTAVPNSLNGASIRSLMNQFIHVSPNTLTPKAEDSIDEYTLNFDVAENVGTFSVTHAVAALTDGMPETRYYATFADALAEYNNAQHAGYYKYIQILDACAYTLPKDDELTVMDPGHTVEGETVPFLTVTSQDENKYVVDHRDGEVAGTTVYFTTTKVVMLTMTKHEKVNTHVQGQTQDKTTVLDPVYLISIPAAVQEIAKYDLDPTHDPYYTYEMEILANTTYDLPAGETLMATVAPGVTFTPGTADTNYRVYAIEGGWGSYRIYTITYELDGGTAGTGTYHTTYTERDANFQIGDPTKTGYTFKGWSGTTLQGDTNKNLTVDLSSKQNLTFTANWTANIYHVVFNKPAALTGVEGTMANQDITYGQTVALSQNLFTRSGYHFVGWSMTDGGEVSYEDGQTVSNLTAGTGNVNLYAKFATNTYTVAFNSNGGSGDTMPNQTFSYGETKALSLNTYTAPTGYDFDGWATSAEGEVDYTDGKQVSNLSLWNNATVTLYAHWSVHQNKVRVLDPENNSRYVETLAYGDTITEEVKAKAVATAEQYCPKGSKFTGFAETWPETMPDQDLVMTAVYEEINYTLTYVDVQRDGTINEIDRASYKYYATVTDIAVPQKDGYEFSAWTYTPELEGGKMPDADVTAVAQWVGNDSTLVFMDRTDTLWVKTYQNGTDLTAEGALSPDIKWDKVKDRKNGDLVLDKDDLWDPAIPEYVEGSQVFNLNWKEMCTVTFVDGETEISTAEVMEGNKLTKEDIPSYNKDGVKPYWLVNGVEGKYFNIDETVFDSDTKLVATWDAPAVDHTVTWQNDDKTPLAVVEVKAGEEEPAYSGPAPIKNSDADGTAYTFKDWDKAVDADQNVTYTAAYIKHNERYAYSVAADDSISILFRIRSFPEGVDKDLYKVEYSFNGKTGERTEDLDQLFTVAACAAKEMVDLVNVTVKYGDTVIAEKEYSVRGYAESRIADGNASESLRNVMKAMLQYGGESQKFFDYKKNDPANKTSGTIPYEPIPENAKNTKDGEANGITGVTYRLIAETRTEFNVSFKHADDAKAEDYTFRVNGVAVEATDENGKFVIDIGGIPAKNLDNKYIVTATDKDGNTFTYTTSPINYMKAVGSDVMKALYTYHYYAKAYLG